MSEIRFNLSFAVSLVAVVCCFLVPFSVVRESRSEYETTITLNQGETFSLAPVSINKEQKYTITATGKSYGSFFITGDNGQEIPSSAVKEGEYYFADATLSPGEYTISRGNNIAVTIKSTAMLDINIGYGLVQVILRSLLPWLLLCVAWFCIFVLIIKW